MRRHTETTSPEETERLAAELARALHPGTVVALRGALGSGKTCFVRGLARGLGVRQAVTSPTFTVVNEYRGTSPLYHIDLYRVRSADEALALGLDEYLDGNGLTAIEWPECVSDLLPPSTVRVTLTAAGDGDTRRIEIDTDPGCEHERPSAGP